MAESTPIVFEKNQLNTVHRSPNRAHYDQATIVSIVREAKIAHVAFVDQDGLPQCVPMLVAFEDPDSPELVLYIHAHPSSRVYKTLSQPNVRLVATSTIVDGYVLALSLLLTDMNYRSAVLHGYTLPPRPDDDSEAAKTAAFARIVNATLPGRWDEARQPNSTELKGAAVIRVAIDSASAKMRTGGPVENKQDLLDEHLTSTVWTGVIPIQHLTATPIPAESSRSIPLPECVKELINIT